MSGLIHKLESNEAVLLMYLAGELPPEDRAEVEQLLSTDPAFRAEFEQLRDAQANADSLLERLDLASGLPAEDLAVQRTGRALRQYQADLLRRHAAPASPPTALRLRWWHPLAAAAAVLIGFLIWWGNVDVAPSPGPGPTQVVSNHPADLASEDEAAEEPLDTAERHALALMGGYDVQWSLPH